MVDDGTSGGLGVGVLGAKSVLRSTLSEELYVVCECSLFFETTYLGQRHIGLWKFAQIIVASILCVGEKPAEQTYVPATY